MRGCCRCFVRLVRFGCCGWSGEMREDGGDDLADFDGFHAAEVDGALAEEAGAALDVVADDAVLRAERAGERGLGAAEKGDCGDAEMGSEVHGAGVVGEEEVAGAKFVHELREGGFADEVGDGDRDGGENGVGDGAVLFDAEEFPFTAGFFVG